MIDAPLIKIEPPGPKAREILELDKKLLMQSFVRWYPLVIERGNGFIVEDVDGNRYIDFNSGLAVLNVGHNHPRVLNAIREMLGKITHYSLTDFYYGEAVELAEKLVSIAPISGDKKVFYGNSGAEAIEACIKISRGHFRNKRPYLIAFYGAFHGRTMGANSLTASKPVQHRWFSPMLPCVIHAPYPYPYRCPFNTDDPIECGEQALAFIEDYILGKYIHGDEVAAIFFEPIQGEGGYVVPPDNFFPGLRKLADEYGILLVDDEVQSGMGRTGKWWAIQHWNIEPDLMAIAKAIASGLPLSAVVGRAEIMDLPGGSHATTFGGNPISCRVALEVIRIIEEEKLLENASRVGEYIMKRFRELQDHLEIIGDVRGKGLMIGVELVRNRETKEPARKELAKVIIESFKRGVLIIGAGLSTLRIAPPLNITIEAVDRALEVIENVLKEVDKEIKAR